MDLLVDSEDGGVDAEGGFSAMPVVVECMDAVGIGCEEFLINLCAKL